MAVGVVTKEIAADTAVVVLTGPLTLGTSLKAADSQMQELIAKGITKLALDLTSVDFADSAGLGAIVHAYGLIQRTGGALRLCGVQPRVAAMLKMTRTELFLPNDLNVEACLAALR